MVASPSGIDRMSLRQLQGCDPLALDLARVVAGSGHSAALVAGAALAMLHLARQPTVTGPRRDP